MLKRTPGTLTDGSETRLIWFISNDDGTLEIRDRDGDEKNAEKYEPNPTVERSLEHLAIGLGGIEDQLVKTNQLLAKLLDEWR